MDQLSVKFNAQTIKILFIVTTNVTQTTNLPYGNVCKHRIIASMPGKQQQEYEHTLAYVKWYQSHPNSDFYGSSAIVCKNTHKEGSSCSFIPVQRIHAVCAYCELDIEIANVLEDVLIAIPLPAKFG